MKKWQYIRRISEYGYTAKTDTILKLLEWCGKPNTINVTEDEARDFWALLQHDKKEGGG